MPENKLPQSDTDAELNELTDEDLEQVSGGTKNTAKSLIKIDGVEGESTHKDHKGDIEILSWSS